MDEQQAQQQRLMALISPVMIGYLGFQYKWPSALILYWLSFNVFAIAQQLFLINRYHRNPAPIGPHPELEAADGQTAMPATAAVATPEIAPNGSSASRRRRRRRSKR